MNPQDQTKTKAVITSAQRIRLAVITIDLFNPSNDGTKFMSAMIQAKALGEEVGIVVFDPVTTAAALSVEAGTEFAVCDKDTLLYEALNLSEEEVEKRVEEVLMLAQAAL